MCTIRPLSDALAKKAAIELNEVPDEIQKNLETIKQWLQKSPHITARTDDQFLLAFLRSCKNSLERVKEKLDMFYTVRSALPHISRQRNPLDARTQDILLKGFHIPLPNTATPDGPRLMIYRPGAYDANIYNVDDTMRVAIMINDMLMINDDHIVVAGQIAIVDLANVTMAHLLQMTPSAVKRLTMLTQEASPLRQKANHYINAPPGSEVVFNLLKSFLNEKNRQRFYVHKSLVALQNAVSKKLLPEEYGGEAGKIEDLVNDLNKQLIANRDYFIEDDKFGVDESKRQGKPKKAESLFGVDGTFRSLNVD